MCASTSIREFSVKRIKAGAVFTDHTAQFVNRNKKFIISERLSGGRTVSFMMHQYLIAFRKEMEIVMKRRLTLTVVLVLLLLTASSQAQVRSGQKFADWSPIVHLGPPINSEFDDHAAVLSKDELTMYFTSNRTGSAAGSEDIWVSTRKSKDSEWGTPVNIGPEINTPAMERVRSFTDDDNILLFQSDRGGGHGLTDIWAVARKPTGDGSFAWGEPENLGPAVNTAFTELAANYLFADADSVQRYFFSSTKPGGFGGPDIYESRISGFGFGDSVNVFELNSPSIETCFWIRDDGLELIFSSNRPNLTGDINAHDMWVATRDSVNESWSAPVRLGPNINVPGYQDVNPALSYDGRTMLMASRRPGGIGPGSFDIYVATREEFAAGE